MASFHRKGTGVHQSTNALIAIDITHSIFGVLCGNNKLSNGEIIFALADFEFVVEMSINNL